MKYFLDNFSNEITFIIVVLLVLGFVWTIIRPRYEYAMEIDYKNKIIEREIGRNFESYEDYLVYRIEMGK